MRPAPVHEHIYSDGKICLNILYSDWDPKMDVKSMCLSLLSMLSSAKKKSRPPDNNQTVVLTQGQQAGSMQWDFHDDNC
jgi:ubiquitin-conjugating enzyme E2 W